MNNQASKVLAYGNDGRRLKRKLQLFLVFFLIVLAVPMTFLIRNVHHQLQKETFFKYKWQAESLLQQLNDVLSSHIELERLRPYDDYNFYKNSTSVDLEHGLTLSPLANKSAGQLMPGLIGYFQLDHTGLFNCPLLPSSDLHWSEIKGIALSNTEVSRRMKIRKVMRALLTESGFLGQEHTPVTTSDIQSVIEETAEGAAVIRVDPMQAKLVQDNFFIFYRDVWMDNKRMVQGFVVKKKNFLEVSIQSLLLGSHFSSDVILQLSEDGEPVTTVSYQTHKGKTPTISFVQKPVSSQVNKFFHGRLISPLDRFSLNFSTDRYPAGPKATAGLYLMVVVTLIVVIGLFLIYRLGVRQISLSEQRLNFVSAVSHELKTPLTSIIMYADMLRSDIVQDDQRKQKYYDFIFLEGERLGRLINNVLRLSCVNQKKSDLSMEYVSVAALIDIARSKTQTLIENAGFNLSVRSGDHCKDDSVRVDVDAFVQVVINLVDNGIKFSMASSAEVPERRCIDIVFCCDDKNPNRIKFCVRDYGPGICEDSKPYIFNLFYRAGSELTRKTQGVGIGLALVHALVQSMGGRIDFRNCDPGVEFCVELQCRKSCL